jgi:hypothetical protein
LSYTDVDYSDALLFPPAEASSEITDFSALVKQSAETLLPLLGQQIRLRLYSEYGSFPVTLRAGQLEGILSRLFVHATDEMESGGTVFIGTGDFRVPEYDYSSSQQEIATHVVLAFMCAGSTSKNVQTVVPSQVNSGGETARLRSMLQELDSLTKESMGYVSLDRFHTDTVIRIYFPVIHQSDATAAGIKPSMSSDLSR